MCVLFLSKILVIDLHHPSWGLCTCLSTVGIFWLFVSLVSDIHWLIYINAALSVLSKIDWEGTLYQIMTKSLAMADLSRKVWFVANKLFGFLNSLNWRRFTSCITKICDLVIKKKEKNVNLYSIIVKCKHPRYSAEVIFWQSSNYRPEVYHH